MNPGRSGRHTGRPPRHQYVLFRYLVAGSAPRDEVDLLTATHMGQLRSTTRDVLGTPAAERQHQRKQLMAGIGQDVLEPDPLAGLTIWLLGEHSGAHEFPKPLGRDSFADADSAHKIVEAPRTPTSSWKPLRCQSSIRWSLPIGVPLGTGATPSVQRMVEILGHFLERGEQGRRLVEHHVVVCTSNLDLPDVRTKICAIERLMEATWSRARHGSR